MVEQYRSIMWKSHDKVHVKIDYLHQTGDLLANQPLFIVDEDPVRLAQALTTDLIKKYIEYIVYSLIVKKGTKTAIKSSGALEKPRVDYMFFNQRTAYWFFRLYTEMQEIYKKLTGKKYRVSEHFKEEWVNNVQRIKSPAKESFKSIRLLAYTLLQSKYKEIYEPYKTILADTISNTSKFRIMYMVMGYLNSEFPFGAPAWYNSYKTTIWKSFNKMTRLYYRIDTSVDGVYTYYYSVDDKNWIEIKNIPPDMRGLIDGIIFARLT